MDRGSRLPFEVGQSVEARSFLVGFRGAWFRCKIKGFSRRNKHLGAALEYIDFPDEKIKWTKLYQKSNRQRQLMVRPCFPPVYDEYQLPDIKSIPEVVVIVKHTWKVGDWVDWWASDCYWSGRLTEKLGPEKFRVELWPRPDGEGLSYEASSKDFRPSLNWSVERGWEVPTPQGGGNLHLCARLINTVEDWEKDQATSASDDMATNADVNEGHPPKKIRSETNISIRSDTTEAAVVDLEELVNRVKWIKSILRPSSNSTQPLWKFVQHGGPPILK